MDSSHYDRGQNVQYRDNKVIALEQELAALRNRVLYLEKLLLNSNEPCAFSADLNSQCNFDHGIQENIMNQCQQRCAFCQDCTHSIHSCEYFGYLQVGDRWNVAKKLKLCFRCLNNEPTHLGKHCMESKVCGINRCRLSHHQLLHDERRRQGFGRSGAGRIQHSVKTPRPSGGCENILNSDPADDNEGSARYFGDIKNVSEFAKSLIVYKSCESDTNSMDSLSESSGGENNQSEKMTGTPSGVQFVETNNFSVPCFDKDMDLSFWLHSSHETELMEPLEPNDELEVPMTTVGTLDTFEICEAIKSTVNGVELNAAECTAPIDLIGKPCDNEFGLIEALGYSMRNLQPAEFTSSGIEMNKAEHVEGLSLNEPPVLITIPCVKKEEQKYSEIAPHVLNGRPEKTMHGQTRGKLLSNLDEYLKKLDGEIQLYESFVALTPPSKGLVKKHTSRKLDESEIDLLM